MKLNYSLSGKGSTVVLLHGLFGSLDNLGLLAREFARDHQVLQLDLRNHGLSPWSDEMSYPLMAEDIQQLLTQLQLKDITVIGHSMGGKVAMSLSAVIPEQIKQIIAMDIAPVVYHENRHQLEFQAMNAVLEAGVVERREATKIMQPFINNEAVIQYLLKSFSRGKWRFNLAALEKNYPQLMGWKTLPRWNKPVYFIAGSRSDYIKSSYREAILYQFPNAKGHIIAGAGHWLHGEKPQQVIKTIRQWLM